jgi:hypothetical protein
MLLSISIHLYMPEGNTPVVSGSSNTMMYIIGGVVVAGLVGFFAMRMIGGAAMSAAGVDADRNMDGSTTYSNGEGSVTVGGASMPDNWPSDAPQNVAGAQIQYAGSSNPQTGEEGAAVSYTAQGSATAVADYYKRELQSKGWAMAGTANMNGATVVSATKDTRSFGAYILDNGNGSVTVTAGLGIK